MDLGSDGGKEKWKERGMEGWSDRGMEGWRDGGIERLSGDSCLVSEKHRETDVEILLHILVIMNKET